MIASSLKTYIGTDDDANRARAFLQVDEKLILLMLTS